MKFGEAGLQLLPEIRSIDSVDALQTILQTLRTANTLDDIRRLYSS
ncbi:hypothetical protein OOK60_14780 [Trichothermofontia sichuanensis B231]|nr:hypothetical protein [Trichothermofontia sichuanensis]UZQ53747.1 hypothetical protein OOK60_14780 [Trichothermofontia sichuanensis B231]